MEATTATKSVSHDIGLATAPDGRSDTERKVLEVLKKAKVIEDRHMTRERIAHQMGAYGQGVGSVYRAVNSLANSKAITERLNRDAGETTYHLAECREPERHPGLFDRMVQGKNTPEVEGPYKCPYCPQETRTEVGRNVHISRVHNGKPLVALLAQASCSAPKSAPTVAAEEEDDEDDEVPDVLNGSGVSSIAVLHKQLMRDAAKHGWTVEILQASKASETGVIKFVYERTASKVAS